MFTEFNFMVWLLFYVEIGSGLVLSFLSHSLHLALQLALPAPDLLVAGIKTELMAYLEILTTHLVPALSFALIIRKLTS
jgi:hypothetical protein